MAELKVSHRAVTGKKVKVLRRQGITPLHIYGQGIESEALQCETAVLKRFLAQAGRTAFVKLQVADEKKLKSVLVREVQRAPASGKLLHVDFLQVSMTEKIKIEVPLVLVGESPALKQKDNMLEHELNSLEIECLPGEIPARIELDISVLTGVDQALRVKDILLAKQITPLNEPDQMVVRVISRPADKEEGEAVEETVVVGEKPKSEAEETSR
ncbi:MAG: 50S ribosomal protein L25 [Dehalococcoidales bacterium]|jgi:large subunit ribosomal protein L25